jgi:ubiquinol-cytochrome c reductase cytochrome b subunit
MGWVEGAIRIIPNWETHIAGTTWSWNVFLPGVGLMGLLFTSLALWPFIEAWITGDRDEHHLLDRPRNAPTRTALGVAGMTLYGLFWLAGGNDIIATTFDVSLNNVTYVLRVAVIVGPIIAFLITRRICASLQRADRNRVLHGSETGVIVRTPDGRYFEDHVPISDDEAFTLTQHPAYPKLEPSPSQDAAGLAVKPDVSKLRSRVRNWYVKADVSKPTSTEIAEAHHHGDHGPAEVEASSAKALTH